MKKISKQIGKIKRAFTLVELLVVILIIAILAAMIVPRIVGRTSQAKQAKALSDIRTLESMLDAYRLDVGEYPTTDDGLYALEEAPAGLEGWNGPYTRRGIPSDPWGNEYYYESPGDNGDDSFLLYTLGSDGQPGGTGEAEDLPYYE